MKIIIFILIILNVTAMYIITKINFFNKYIYRFIFTGGLNTFIYYFFYLIFIEHIKYIQSHLIAFLISALISFFITTKYTFSEQISLIKFIFFPLTFLPNLVISTIFTIFFVQFNLITQTYASIISMLIAIPITFLVSKKIIIGNKK